MCVYMCVCIRKKISSIRYLQIIEFKYVYNENYIVDFLIVYIQSRFIQKLKI